MSILRMRAIMAEFGYRSHASVYCAIHAGLLTHPVLTGQRAVGIPSHEVQAVVAARIAGQSEDQIRQLVNRLHEARCAASGEPFKPTWLERSAAQKQQAARRKKRTKRIETTPELQGVVQALKHKNLVHPRQEILGRPMGAEGTPCPRLLAS